MALYLFLVIVFGIVFRSSTTFLVYIFFIVNWRSIQGHQVLHKFHFSFYITRGEIVDTVNRRLFKFFTNFGQRAPGFSTSTFYLPNAFANLNNLCSFLSLSSTKYNFLWLIDWRWRFSVTTIVTDCAIVNLGEPRHLLNCAKICERISWNTSRFQ